MLRNINFFNVKPDANEEQMLALLNNDLAVYAQSFGCLERKTWKLLDYHGEQAEQPDFKLATYINESLWPSQQEADAYSRADGDDALNALKEQLFRGIDFVLTVRYVDTDS